MGQLFCMHLFTNNACSWYVNAVFYCTAIYAIFYIIRQRCSQDVCLLHISFVYLECHMLTTILQSVTKSCISHLPGTNMATPQIAKQPYKISKHLCKYLPRSLKNAFLLLKRHDSRFGMLMNGCKKANQFFAICYKIPCLVSAIIVVNLSLWYFFSNLECCLWSKIVAFFMPQHYAAH